VGLRGCDALLELGELRPRRAELVLGLGPPFLDPRERLTELLHRGELSLRLLEARDRGHDRILEAAESIVRLLRTAVEHFAGELGVPEPGLEVAPTRLDLRDLGLQHAAALLGLAELRLEVGAQTREVGLVRVRLPGGSGAR